MAFIVGGTEFVGGVLLVLGLLTRPAALGLAVSMFLAIKLAHWKQGLIGSASGYMYALSMFGSMLGLLFLGAGGVSADSEAVRRFRARQSRGAGAAVTANECVCQRGLKSRIGIA
jgi:putative oxidoreductase